MKETTHRALRLALASLLVVALLSGLAIGMSRSDLVAADFFSSFTILSTLLAVTVLATQAWHPERNSSPYFSVFRGAVTVCMILTGLVFAVMLAPAETRLIVTEPWVDWTLYVVGPVALTLDWFLHRPAVALPRSAPVIWTAFPAAYLVYSLSRGAVTDRYAYPFLDPTESGGYPEVLMGAGILLAVALVLGYACLWWVDRRRPAPATA